MPWATWLEKWSRSRSSSSRPFSLSRSGVGRGVRAASPPQPKQPLSSPSALIPPPHLAQRMNHLMKKWRRASSPHRCPHPGWRSRCPCIGEGTTGWLVPVTALPSSGLSQPLSRERKGPQGQLELPFLTPLISDLCLAIQ